MSPILELRNLRCERDDRVLFEGLHCQIQSGEVVQILGPNGSGKTTLLRMILGLTLGYSGDIVYRGQMINTDRLVFNQNLLYIGHQPAVNRSLTPLENLDWLAKLHGQLPDSNPLQALKAVGLRGFEDTPGFHLSAGQHRRVALARLFLTGAQIWILDEPFTAIDKAGIDTLRERLSAHVHAGGIVLITTHQDLGVDNVRVLHLGDFPPRHREVA